MNNVMTPSGASTAVTGAPGVMVPPCDTLDWVRHRNEDVPRKRARVQGPKAAAIRPVAVRTSQRR